MQGALPEGTLRSVGVPASPLRVAWVIAGAIGLLGGVATHWLLSGIGL